MNIIKNKKSIATFASIAFVCGLGVGVNLFNTSNKNVIESRAENIVDVGALTSSYVAQDGDVLTGTSPDSAYYIHIDVADGAHIKLRNLSILGYDEASLYDSYPGIKLKGDATITLEGTNIVYARYVDSASINVPEDKTLTIDAVDENATLDVRSYWGAAIGANDEESCGNIVINGGKITGHSNMGAVIGAANSADGLSNCGNITINGGDLTLTNDGSGAAIGCGEGVFDGRTATCGDILITGGKINAVSTGDPEEDAHPAIGTSIHSDCGNITITGGELNLSAQCGPAIGATYLSNCKDIKISGGKITAIGGVGSPAIGAYDVDGSYRSITIEKTVTMLNLTKGEGSDYIIGPGGEGVESGTIIIGGLQYAPITANTFTYPNPVFDTVGLINLIENPVKYTNDCKTHIDAAQQSYDALNDAQKAEVSNHDKLVNASATYYAVDNVVKKIDAIGEVTKDSGEAIKAAREAYDALSEANKALVPESSLNKLTLAEKAYEELIAKKGLSAGAIAGIAAGSSVALLGIGFVLYKFVFKKRA